MNTLFVSGAGFQICLLIGAIEKILEEYSFQNFVGTSAGAYICLSLVLGWKPRDLINWLEANYNDLRRDLSYSYFRFLTNGSLISKASKDKFILRMIRASPVYQRNFQKGPNEITFRDLSPFGNFICNATCYETRKISLFCKEITPDLPIYLAVGASMSLIGLFEPTLLPDGYLYIDGSFTCDYLPTVFDSSSINYYKHQYPNVDIPIDLSQSRGCLNNSLETLSISPGTRWGIFSLIQFIPQLINYFKSNLVREESYTILKDRTWQVSSVINPSSFPSISVGWKLYQEGYRQVQDAMK